MAGDLNGSGPLPPAAPAAGRMLSAQQEGIRDAQLEAAAAAAAADANYCRWLFMFLLVLTHMLIYIYIYRDRYI